MKNYIYLFLFLIAATLISCEDVINVKLNSENLNLIGVEATITTLDKPTVFLYKTLMVNQDEAYTGISGALVTISDNDTPASEISLIEDPEKKGFYLVPQNTDYYGFAGKEYTLTIISGGVTMIAKDKLLKVEPIDSMQVFPSLRGGKRFLGVFTYGREPAGIGNFYKWDVYVNDSLINDANRISIASDEIVDGNYISKLEVYTDFFRHQAK